MGQESVPSSSNIPLAGTAPCPGAASSVAFPNCNESREKLPSKMSTSDANFMPFIESMKFRGLEGVWRGRAMLCFLGYAYWLTDVSQPYAHSSCKNMADTFY